MKTVALLLLLAGITFGQTNSAVKPQLNLKALSEPIQNLSTQDRKVVDEAVKLINQGQHAEALAALTRLTQNNSQNSAIRVLRAYTLLELGNVAAALDDATIAESAGGHAAYRCWFLAQVAYLAGDKPLCHREINHVHADPTYGPEAEKLRHRLDAGAR